MSRPPEFDLEFSSESCPCGCRGDAALHEAFESGLSGEAWRQRRPSRPGPGGPGSGPRPPARPGPRHRPGPFRPGIVPLYEPYAAGPGPEAGTEHARWVQDCLNRIFGLQLPVDGFLDAATRSAIRRLQREEGVPVTGAVSPATDRALQRRCRKKGTPVEGEWPGERRELPPVAAPPRCRLVQQPIPAALKGLLDQARKDINNALLTASRKLDQAIKNRNNGAPIPMDVFNAYQRFFRGSGLDKLDLLKIRVDNALQWIAGMPFDPIPNPVPAGYRDEVIHRRGVTNPLLNAAAVQPPDPKDPRCLVVPKPAMCLVTDCYIAIYPPWFNDASMGSRASKILHELFHYFPDVQHPTLRGAPTEPAWKNARAYQGFVGSLAGLPELAGVTAMFPP